MFSLEPNTSKMALIYLCKILMDNDVKLIDCQFETPHLTSMGGRTISYDEYMKIMVS
ncbi:MAG: leucyl/phenylalanyl-tRNA--protein transferase, partial [Bacteroidales bacterium]|nr:leucyl/phenylalanyl-tRNA--protein transferase [Bacteroidales bacterium]